MGGLSGATKNAILIREGASGDEQRISEPEEGKMNDNEYAASFTKKMKLVPYLVPNELSNINKFVSGLLTVKLETSLEATIWEAKNVKTQIREKGLKRDESREKSKFEG